MAEPLRNRIVNAIRGTRAKDYIPSLGSSELMYSGDNITRNNYVNKSEQLLANVGWVFAANDAIAPLAADVPFKLYRRKNDGDLEEVRNGQATQIINLLEEPNMAMTGDELRELHYTYMNFTGESYILMMKGGEPFIPAKGQLPDALHILPSHLATFKLGKTNYQDSVVKFGQQTFPIASVIRSLNPDPYDPYTGRSIIRAAAIAVDTEDQMKEWNRGFFANNARPSLIFSSDEPLDDAAYERWKKQFQDEHTGTNGAYKPLLIEGGKATPWMLSQTDLDFLNSRKFSKDEILAMFKVAPSILGMTENVNKANADAADYIHAKTNITPRVKKLVRQIQKSLISVYDPTLVLGFENPIPEDIETKLKAAKEGVNAWKTIDETREEFGLDALPNGAGEVIYIDNKLIKIEDVGTQAPTVPNDQVTAPTKSLTGVKKNN